MMGNDKGPIADVREGMRVVDSGGQDVGSVDAVHMGDPQAVTAEGQGTARSSGIGAMIADALSGGGDVPDEARARLARLGYLQVDAAGLFAGNRYVAADEIAQVTGDTVHLSVAADRLLG